MILQFFQICSRFSVEKINGVSPIDASKYRRAISLRKNTFTCFDKSKIISLDQVNDGYCDCPDGSDEPGTNACNSGEFYCRNLGSVPKTIPKWMVNDGVCDCCDGSDEAGNPHAHCEDACGIIRQKAIAFRKNLTNTTSEGMKLRAKYSERGRLELNILRKQLQHVESLKTKLYRSSDLAEKLYWQINPGDDFDSDARQMFNQYKLLLQEVQADFDSLMESIDGFRKGSRKIKKEVPHYGRFNLKHRAELYYNVENAIVWLPDFQSTFSRLKNIFDICNSFLEAFQEGERPSKATSSFNKISALLSKIENTTAKIENIMELNFGPDKELLPLYKNWYYFEKNDYYIEFYPYFNVSKTFKNGVSKNLGVYNQTEGFQQFYSHGFICHHNEPGAFTEVNMHCHLKDEILNFHEEDVCHFVLDFGTPTACKPEYKQHVDSMDDITLDDWAKQAGLFK